MTPHIARRFRTASRPLGALAAVLSLALSSIALVAAPARAAETPTTGFSRAYTAPNGLSSVYHVHADGIDRSKPVGVAFYFDGDGQYWAQRPTGSMVRSMAQRAAAQNMILVVPVSPDRASSTWWARIDANGDWFRALSAHLVQRYGLDTGRVWLTGYSGGAQFITKEVLADRQNWIRGGGAVVIGGGGSRGMQTAPSAAVKSLPIQWTTGADDVAGATQPASWSALADARRGQQGYIAAGFTRTSLQVPAGVNHHEYDQAAIFGAALRSYASAPRPSTPLAGSSTRFTDVAAGSPFAAEISWLAAQGIAAGWPDGTFRPGADVDRATMAAFLYRLAGRPDHTPPRTSPFADVPTDHVFYKEISWLRSEGISTGWVSPTGVRTFAPGRTVTRDQTAAFLHRLAGRPSYTAPDSSPFRDVPTGHPFYREMAWLQASGISTGWDDGTYRPSAGTTRGVMAAFLHRFDQRFG